MTAELLWPQGDPLQRHKVCLYMCVCVWVSVLCLLLGAAVHASLASMAMMIAMADGATLGLDE